MSGQRRLQRRSQASRVRSVLTQTQQALSSLQGAGLDQVPVVIQQVQEQTKRASALAEALADDYETVLGEVEIQREVTLRLCAAVGVMRPDLPLHQWRELENQTRLRVIEERERKNGESTI